MNREKQSTLRTLFSYLIRETRALIGVIFFGLLTGATALATPYIIGRTIDRIIQEKRPNLQNVISLLLVLFLLYVVGSISQWLLSICANRVAVKTTSRIRQAAFDRLSAFSLNVLDEHPAGEFISRLTNDAEAISDGINQLLLQLGSGVITMLGSLALMLLIDVRVALAAIVVTPLNFLVTALINRNSRAMYRRQAEVAGKLNAFADETIDGQVVARAYGAGDQFYQSFVKLNEELYEVGQKAQFYSSLTNPGTRFVNNIAYVLVGIISCYVSLQGAISVGAISGLLSYVLQFAKPVNELAAVSSQFQNALAGCERLFALISTEVEELRSHLPDLEVRRGEVAFEQVDFSYIKGKPWIQNLNMYVPPKGKVAIVGPTGAGKTTLVNLLMNFYSVDAGVIRVDQSGIEDVNVSSLRQSFGMVLQESWLFSGSVRANIAYGKPDATNEEVIEAAKSAHAHDFIQRLPQGYETILTDNGAALSTGEKQLLTIARAFLLQPKMLILDEATSNIDTRTERLIQQAFDRMMAGRTAFIIAHRLSTIREADIILVMQDGKIVQQGNHEELVGQQGLYRTLYNSQFKYLSVQ